MRRLGSAFLTALYVAALLLTAVSILCSGNAGAQGLTVMGDPCAFYDADAGVLLQHDMPLPDGGAEDVPAPICEGQRAPEHGVFLTVKEAAKRAAEREELRTENAALKTELTKADAIPGWVWLVTCAASVAVGGYVAAHHK